MTPKELLQKLSGSRTRRKPREEEHRLQVACVRAFRLRWPRLEKRLFAVPNGARRDAVTGARLKAEGVLPGVSDLILLVPSGPFGALLIEMKAKDGTVRKTQQQWRDDLTQGGEYRYVVCRSLEDFMREVRAYLNNEK